MTDGNGAQIHIQVLHTPGISRVLYAPKSAGVDRLFTAGDDYLVRLLPTAHDSTQEALLIDDATAPITSIDAGKTHLVVASEDGSVRLYKHQADSDDDGDQAYGDEVTSPTQIYGVLARTSLPTRCVALEKAVAPGKSPRAAICSDELIVKVVDVQDTKRVNLLTGHSRAVRTASWSPLNATLVTSSCDGTARVWDCTTAEPGCTKVIENLPSTRPEDETDIHAEWHPSGEFFVLPSKTNELMIYSTAASYAKSGVFAAPPAGTSALPSPTGAITASSFCPNGRYLASATTDGQVTVWETSSRAPIRAQRAESNVTSISWHPDSDTLAWIDTNGQLIRWQDVVGHQYPSPYEQVAHGSKHRQTDHQRKSQIDDLFSGTGLDDDDDEDEDGPNEVSRGHAPDDGDDGLDDFVVDDNGDGRYSKAAGAERTARDDYRKRSRHQSTSSSAVTKAQPPFQPNSTPMRNSRRFLSLSLFGSLISIDQDTHHVVSFESFDSAARRNWKLVDHFGYSMASVGATGALLACPQKSDSPSALHFKPFEAAGAWSAPGAEWDVELPLGEQVIAVAMGGAPPSRRSADDDEDAIAKTAAALTATAVVATSSGYLRFFSSSGLQRYVWSFGAQIVAMAAGKQHAIIVHRNDSGGANDGYQNLSYSLIDLISFEVRQTGSVPLGKDVQLRWVGFNELDIAVIYDSRGVVCLLDRAFAASGQARWVPVLESASVTGGGDETREDGADSATSGRVQFWPLSLSSTQLFCVFVRGAVQFPDPSASGHPLIQEVDLKVPLLNAKQPSGALEEKHLRQTLLASSIRSAFASLAVPPTEYASDVPDPATLVHDADKDVLQMIQLACKDDKHARAWDAARELHNGRMLDAALQIASFFHLPSLADRMSTLREWVENRSERDERLELQGPNGVGVDEFSEHNERSRRRAIGGGSGGVFAAQSQSPEVPTRSRPGGGLSAATARKALTEGFEGAGTPRRSQVSRRGGGEDGLVRLSGMTESSTSTPLQDMNGSYTNRKRSLDEDVGAGDEEAEVEASERMPAPQMPAKQPRTTSTSSGSSRGNPFARQPGSMTRDRSMHKSNSFFDRAEADLSALGGEQSSRRSGQQQQQNKKTKQSTLFGSINKGKPSSSSSSGAAARATFAETQAEEESQGYEESESVRATLASVADEETRREARGGLEETQYGGGDEDEETQLMDVDGMRGGSSRRDESQSQSQSQSQAQSQSQSITSAA